MSSYIRVYYIYCIWDVVYHVFGEHIHVEKPQQEYFAISWMGTHRQKAELFIHFMTERRRLILVLMPEVLQQKNIRSHLSYGLC